PKRRASLKAGMTSVSLNGVSPPPSAPEAVLSSLSIMGPFSTGIDPVSRRGVPPVERPGAGGPDEASGEDRGVGDGGTRERGSDDLAVPDVHHHVVNLIVVVEVEIEEQVTWLQGVERDVGQGRPLALGRPGAGDTRLSPGPLHQSRAV